MQGDLHCNFVGSTPTSRPLKSIVKGDHDGRPLLFSEPVEYTNRSEQDAF
jgi:hypothetical protein